MAGGCLVQTRIRPNSARFPSVCQLDAFSGNNMRTTAFLIMTSSFLVLIGVTHRAVTISVSVPPGMLNPTIHFSLHPDSRDIFYSTLLAAAVSAYGYAVIAWTEQRLEQLRASIAGAEPENGFTQPADLRLLKDAIRAGNVAAVRRYARESVLQSADERYLTPLELADVYGRQPVVDALGAAMLKHAKRNAAPGQRVALPSSPFSLRRG